MKNLSSLFSLIFISIPNILVVTSVENSKENENCIIDTDGTQICPNNNLTNECSDLHDQCQKWAESGDCISNERSQFMQTNCKLSCGSCIEYIPNITTMEAIATYGKAQEINGVNAHNTMQVIESTIEYMKKMSNVLSSTARANCVNTHKKCSMYASQNKCNTHLDYMAVRCGPSCKACHLFNALDTKYDTNDLGNLLYELVDGYEMENDEDADIAPVDKLLIEAMEEYGVAQEYKKDESSFPSFMEVVTTTLLYMKSIEGNDNYETCENTLPDCSTLAADGQCQDNKKKCGPSCQSCTKKIKVTILEDVIDNNKLDLLLNTLRNDKSIQQNTITKTDLNVDDELTANEILLLKGIQKHGVEQEVSIHVKDKSLEMIQKTLLYMLGLDERTAKMCRNKNSLCTFWAIEGECIENESFMIQDCAPSCGECQVNFDVDGDELAALLKELEDEINVDDWDNSNDGTSQTLLYLLEAIENYGVTQAIHEDEMEQNVLASAIIYMRKLTSTNNDMIKKCRNLEDSCAIRAFDGDCNFDDEMIKKCAPICRACHKLVDDD